MVLFSLVLAGTIMGQKNEQSTPEGGPFLLINELEADPGNQQNDSCQYIELRGTPGATVAANTYFVAIDSDPAFTGRLHHVVPIGGVQIGSNGLIYLNNTVAPVCPNRTPAAETTVVNYSSVIRIGGGDLEVRSESFAVFQTAANIFAGLDIDANDDGEFDIAVTNISDAVAFRVDPDQEYVYPANSAILGTPFANVPDAFVRFPGNDTAFNADAFYYGELAADPVESTVFVAPFSANFPTGGALTPGAPNVPATTPTGNARSDFDGDGRTDISVFRPSEGNWYLLRSTEGFGVLNWGLSSDILVPGDYDGDGRTDTAIFRPSATPGTADFWILRSDGFTVLAVEFGSPGDVPANGDFDGDSLQDLAVYRASEGNWYINLTSNGQTLVVNNPGNTPVPGDYDGDGNADGIIFTDGAWVGTLSTGPQVNISLGQAGDIPVPGDFDGDGIDDQAIFRPSTGSWIVRNSSTTNITTTAFGIATDIPAPGDYDGDGTEDFAIFRSGQWWINGSTSGVSVVSFGLGSDVPVVAEAGPQ